MLNLLFCKYVIHALVGYILDEQVACQRWARIWIWSLKFGS